MNLTAAVFTDHALARMQRRQLTEAQVRALLAAPEEVVAVRAGRVVAQAAVGDMVVRVFVDVDREPPEVVTAYRTSKVEKYRSRP